MASSPRIFTETFNSRRQTPELRRNALSLFIVPPRAQASRRCETQATVRVRDETTASRGGLSGGDCVVPFAVEVVGLDVDLGHFGVGDLDGFRVVVVVETAMDGEPGPGRGGADQSHDHGMGEQGFAAPV